MAADLPKQFLYLGGKPILALTLDTFQRCNAIDAIILVCPAKDIEYCRVEIVQRFGLNKVKRIVPGGARRQDSVRFGLEATDGQYDRVVIHDGVRPLVDASLIERIIEKVNTDQAVITALPAKDTVKETGDLHEVVKTLERHHVWLVQTPQAFFYEVIASAHSRAFQEGWSEATDDSILVERMGIPVKVIEGSEKNIKITTPFDLKLASFFLDHDS